MMNASKQSEGKTPDQGYLQTVQTLVFENLTLYCRDMPQGNAYREQYPLGLLLHEHGYLHASRWRSRHGRGLRYMIYSNAGERMRESFPEQGGWSFPMGSYFKVVAVHAHGESVAVVLLHVPKEYLSYFALHRHPAEQTLAQRALTDFKRDLDIPTIPELADLNWSQRTGFPVGLDEAGRHMYRFDYTGYESRDPLRKRTGLLSRLFRKGKK